MIESDSLSLRFGVSSSSYRGDLIILLQFILVGDLFQSLFQVQTFRADLKIPI